MKDVPEGSKISSSDLQERFIKTSKAPEDAISASTLAIGRIARYDITRGQILSQHALTAADILEKPTLKNGMRAVSFCVDTAAGVSGFITPGSEVDILAIFGSRIGRKAQPILSDVEVLRVGQNHEKQAGPSSRGSVTFFTVALVPKDATTLAKAASAGKLYLTLRQDQDHTPTPVVDIDSLLGKH